MRKIKTDGYLTHILNLHKTNHGYFARVKILIENDSIEAYVFSPDHIGLHTEKYTGVTPKHAYHVFLTSTNDLSIMCNMGLNESSVLPVSTIFDALYLIEVSCSSWLVWYIKTYNLKLTDSMSIHDLLVLFNSHQNTGFLSYKFSFIKHRIELILSHQNKLLSKYEKRELKKHQSSVKHIGQCEMFIYDSFVYKSVEPGKLALKFWKKKDANHLETPYIGQEITSESLIKGKYLYCMSGFYVIPLEDYSEYHWVVNDLKETLTMTTILEYYDEEVVDVNRERHEVRVKGANIIYCVDGMDFSQNDIEAKVQSFQQIKNDYLKRMESGE